MAKKSSSNTLLLMLGVAVVGAGGFFAFKKFGPGSKPTAAPAPAPKPVSTAPPVPPSGSTFGEVVGVVSDAADAFKSIRGSFGF